MINKILFITLSNIGDVILTLPVLDSLRERFPQAKITVMVGPRPKGVFENNPNINRLIIYDKHSRLKEKIKLFVELKQEKFDMAVDLRNTFYSALLPVKYKTSPFSVIPEEIKHMKDRHLCKSQTPSSQNKSLYIHPKDEEYATRVLGKQDILETDELVIIAPGARSHIKRWPKEKFTGLIPRLIKECNARVILVGDKDDIPINKYITEHSEFPVLDLTAKTTIPQLACLLKKASLLVTCDSAVLHLASYLDVPVAAVFGPTNEEKYGPWSKDSTTVKKDIFCRPCEKAQCELGTLECMQLIKVEDVLRQVRNLLAAGRQPALSKAEGPPAASQRNDFKRILIVRTDRIGDVLLSTPVIKALRDAYPCAYIAMAVSPYARDIIEGNPYLDQVIIYDKDNKHKSWLRSVKFALGLKKKRFGLALILHPTNRAHLVTFLAGIPRRVGFARRLGFLLTDRIRHAKQSGEKHELEYSLDLVRYLGIEPRDKDLFMPIKPESEKWAQGLFIQEGIKENDLVLAIHPGASCPSKVWPSERFAQAADRLKEKYGFKVLIVSGPRDIALALDVVKHMHCPAVNLGGKTSISQLASVLKRCQLFISNDSGPVHIASAVGVPVISIFGRNQRGLSPARWGPVGKKDCTLHKEVGCVECLAHNCVKGFACLKAITVDDVINTVDLILKNGIGRV